MVVINAKIILDNIYNSEYSFLNNNLRCVFEIEKKACEVMIQSRNSNYFTYNKEENVKIIMPIGECLLQKLSVGKNFNLLYGKKVGAGVITEILEVYVEKNGLGRLKDIKEIKKIVRLAEKIDNALIYEDVYKWLEMVQD